MKSVTQILWNEKEMLFESAIKLMQPIKRFIDEPQKFKVSKCMFIVKYKKANFQSQIFCSLTKNQLIAIILIDCNKDFI